MMQLAISAIASLAGLFHDIGKATEGFQRKLRANCTPDAPEVGPDPIKHELMGVLILEAWLSENFGAFLKMDDMRWLEVMADPSRFRVSMASIFPKGRLVDERHLMDLHTNNSKTNIRSMEMVADTQNPYFIGSAIRSALMFLIVSHHKMPSNDFMRKGPIYPVTADVFLDPEARWRKSVWSSIPTGGSQLWDDEDSLWLQNVSAVASEIISLLPALRAQLASTKTHGVAFLTGITHVARPALIQADFEISSRKWMEPQTTCWSDSAVGWANTVGDERPGQPLDEHLCKVGMLAPKYVAELFKDGAKIERAINGLESKDVGDKFQWQVEAENLLSNLDRQHGLMILLMAGTGTGKTIGAARMMKAISPDGMRFNVALGLRTLTLQTIDSYKRNLGLKDSEAALVMGCDVQKAIHKSKSNLAKDGSHHGLDVDTDHVVVGTKTFSKMGEKMRIFEDCPVVVSTIDSIIDSVVSNRNTGILSTIRVATADIIIDEIDSYSESDLVSVVKLVFLTGFFGRVPIVSSATITPEIANVIFEAFRAGYSAGAAYRGVQDTVNVAWISEESAANKIEHNVSRLSFPAMHDAFAISMIERLSMRGRKRKADLLTISDMKELDNVFGVMKRACQRLHGRNFEIDPITGKKLSFGLVRLSTVEACKDFALHLRNNNNLDGIELRICCYHSQQMVGFQHCYEEFYNEILSRKPIDGAPAIFENPVARSVLDSTNHSEVMLIMVSSPIEEVGRDHDFDWGIVEPTSLRAIIQTAGRIRRHRDGDYHEVNLLLLSTTLRSVKFPFAKEFFAYPGPETPSKNYENIFSTFSKNTRAMISMEYMRKSVDSRECVLPTELIQSELSRRERVVQRLHFWPSEKAPGNLNAMSYIDEPVLRFGGSHNDRFKFRGDNDTVSYAFLGNNEWLLKVNGQEMAGNYSDNLQEIDADDPIWLYVPTSDEVDRRYRQTFSNLSNEQYRSIMYVFSVNRYEKEGVPRVGYSVQSGAFKIKA